jgi:tetratricopeptide (TPR) repeat protein
MLFMGVSMLMMAGCAAPQEEQSKPLEERKSMILVEKTAAGRIVIRGEVVYRPNDEVLPIMSYSQAKKRIESMENRQWPPFPDLNDSWVRHIRISSDKLTWDWVCPQSKYCSLIVETSYFQSMDIRVCPSTHEGQGAFRVNLGDVRQEKSGRGSRTEEGDEYFWETPSKDEAVSVANALYVLKRHAEGYREDDDKFADEARRYREMPVKPPLPEETKRYRVMAEDAFNNKEFEKALDYYLKGLAIDPLWPDGQFNAAIIAGDLHVYDVAVSHMRRYLELRPEAADAKAAKEKLYLWEGREKEENQQQP